MAALTLADMLTRVKRNVPITTMDTELQDSLLERMNYIVSLDAFPFQEGYFSASLASGAWQLATPSNFAYPKELIIYTADYERPLIRLDASEFDSRFPMPSNETSGEPAYYCIKVAEGEIWLNCPADQAYTVRMLFHKVPDDVTDTTVSQLVELAKLTLIKWASADGFRMLQEHDVAGSWEAEGNKFFAALEKRYALSREEGACVVSQKAHHVAYRGK